jgi:Gpi18-like mannosyltransferase
MDLKKTSNTVQKALRSPYFLLISVLWVIIVVTLPRSGFFYDEQSWFNWMDILANDGVIAIYQRTEINYLPMYMYILQVVSFLFLKTTEARALFTPYLKLIPLAFDICSLLLVLQIVKNAKLSGEKILFLGLNIAFIYNTLIWGQIDSIPTFLALLSLWFAVNQKSAYSVLAFVLALNFKIQAVVFAPIIFLLLFPQLWRKKLSIITLAVVAFVFESIILSPYILTGNFWIVWRVVISLVDYFPYISANAFNFWVIVKGTAGMFTPDSSLIMGFVSYKNIGMGLFLVSSLFALLPVIKLVWQDVFLGIKVNWQSKKVLSKVFLVAGLCAFNFFFFNTQMHERYLHPAILFFAIAGILEDDYLAYVLLSVGYFLNLEIVMKYTTLGLHRVELLPVVVAWLLFVALIAGYYQLYRGKYGIEKSHSVASLAVN